MNDGGDCRTASATPGLLNISALLGHQLIFQDAMVAADQPVPLLLRRTPPLPPVISGLHTSSEAVKSTASTGGKTTGISYMQHTQGSLPGCWPHTEAQPTPLPQVFFCPVAQQVTLMVC